MKVGKNYQEHMNGKMPCNLQVEKVKVVNIFHHIKGVMDILLKEERETDDVILTIAALQNIVSDTDCTNKEIEERFGKEVAEGVNLLTRKDGQSIQDYTRQVFTNEDYLYIREIKLADILYNLRTLSQTASPQKGSQMIDETEQYILPYEKCSPRNLMNRVKEELGDLKKFFNLKKDFKEEPDEIIF